MLMSSHVCGLCGNEERRERKGFKQRLQVDLGFLVSISAFRDVYEPCVSNQIGVYVSIAVYRNTTWAIQWAQPRTQSSTTCLWHTMDYSVGGAPPLLNTEVSVQHLLTHRNEAKS